MIFVLFVLFPASMAGPDEKRLIETLLHDYNPIERPVANESDTVPLQFGIYLQQIVDLDEKNQILTANVWLDMVWHDASMIWNASFYNNVEDIRITPDLLWRPDLLLYNSANEDFDATYPSHLIVQSNGEVSQIPPGLFKSTCEVDITWFPFDEQTCILKFGTWTNHEALVNLTLKDEVADTSAYQENAEWQLLSAKAFRNKVKYACCPEVYLDITFKVRIQRRTIYYFNNLIIPCVMIASMVIFGFQTPPDSGEKLTLCITILMSLTFFMNMVSAMQPPSSDTPLIGTYFSCIMLMVACSVVCTVLILNYHERTGETHIMPWWVETIFLQWLPWILMMERPGSTFTYTNIMMDAKMKKLERGDKMPRNLVPDLLDTSEDFLAGNLANSHFPMANTHGRTELKPTTGIWSTLSTISPADSHLSLPPLVAMGKKDISKDAILSPPGQSVKVEAVRPATSLLEKDLQNILKEILVISNKIRRDEDVDKVASEWKFAAMVMDRLCLVVFFLFTTILSAAVFISAPNVIVY